MRDNRQAVRVEFVSTFSGETHVCFDKPRHSRQTIASWAIDFRRRIKQCREYQSEIRRNNDFVRYMIGSKLGEY